MDELYFVFQAMKGFLEFFLVGFVIIVLVGFFQGRRKFVGRVGHFEYDKSTNKWIKNQHYRVPDDWNYEIFITQNKNLKNQYKDRYYGN